MRHLDIVDAARMFAAVDMSEADAIIAVWHAKYVYGFWRPITAINLADTDGNPATTADPTWTPLLTTPPYPEYASGYYSVSPAPSPALWRTAVPHPAPATDPHLHRGPRRRPPLRLRQRRA